MKKIYGIIGSGDASAKAIATALDDLEKDAVFYVPFHRSLAMETVYDWLIDNEREFVVVGNPGKVLRQYAEDVRESTINDANISVLFYLQDTGATVLVLWEDGLDDVILKAHNEGHKILELSNGLAPITIEDDEEEAPAAKEPVTEPETVTFSREELETMPVSAVKRYATNYGLDIKGMTKDEIIDALYPSGTSVETAPEPTPQESVVVSPIAAIVVVYANGTTSTFNGDMYTLERMISVI